MGMKVNGTDTMSAYLRHAAVAVDRAILTAFAYAGEYAVTGIRTKAMSSWEDQSGNLRSSIGYAVVRKGRIVLMSGFDVVAGGGQGSANGKKITTGLAHEYSQYPYVLIVVAGMEYAVYVEAMDNKVVLAGGQLWLENNISSILQKEVKKGFK